MSSTRCFSRVLCLFQAEDGIRDTSVTGVQTCALPILPRDRDHAVPPFVVWVVGLKHTNRRASRRRRPARGGRRQIGRASCRERGYISGGLEAVRWRRGIAARRSGLVVRRVATERAKRK